MKLGKSAVLGTWAVTATSMVALVAVWAWVPVVGGPTSNAGLKWNVEYWHRDADGELLQYGKDSNAIVASGLAGC